MFQKFTFIAVFILLISACKSKVILDNPTDSDIVVSLDGTNYELLAYDQKVLELKKSTMLLIAKDVEGNEILNESINITGDGVMNPTRTMYVIWKDMYCLPEDYDTYKGNLDLKKMVTVNDKEYEMVDFTLVEDLFIAKNWDFDLNESFADSVDLKNKFLVKSKIYRVEDLETEFGYFGDIDFSDFDETEVQSFMDSLRQILNLNPEENEEE